MLETRTSSFRRSLKETGKTEFSLWQTMLITALIFALSAGIHWYRFGRVEAMEEINFFVSYSIAVAVFLLLYWLINLVRSPYLNEKDRRIIAEERVDELHDSLLQAENKIQRIHSETLEKFRDRHEESKDSRRQFREQTKLAFNIWIQMEKTGKDDIMVYIKEAGVPDGLPFDKHQTNGLVDWWKENSPNWTGSQATLRDFAKSIYARKTSQFSEDHSFNDYESHRAVTAKFWDRFGHDVKSGALQLKDIEGYISACAFELIILAYIEPAHLNYYGTDISKGKQGLYMLAKYAHSILIGNHNV